MASTLMDMLNQFMGLEPDIPLNPPDFSGLRNIHSDYPDYDDQYPEGLDFYSRWFPDEQRTPSWRRGPTIPFMPESRADWQRDISRYKDPVKRPWEPSFDDVLKFGGWH